MPSCNKSRGCDLKEIVMTINLIACYDLNRAIGKDNELLYSLPSDMKYFREVTTDSTVIMGRKTYESIGKPLPNRNNIILTRDKNFTAEGFVILHSIEDVLALKDEEIFVIGGEELYKQFLPYANFLYLTIIDEHYEGADSFFPDFNDEEWDMTMMKKGTIDEKNIYEHTFYIYEKRAY
jgi:dihydrofolate reductase